MLVIFFSNALNMVGPKKDFTDLFWEGLEPPNGSNSITELKVLVSTQEESQKIQ